MSRSKSKSRKTTGKYCPTIADCEAPYKCVDGFCRITCKHNNFCPNKWKCSQDGFCLDDRYFLKHQQKAANMFARGRPKEVVPQPAILVESRAYQMDTWLQCIIGGVVVAILGYMAYTTRKECMAKGEDSV